MKKLTCILISIILLIRIVSIGDIYALSENELVAKSALLMDQKTGRVLFEKNGYVQMPMASTTKIMTCMYVLENADLDMKIKVSALAARAPEVKLFIREDESYRLGDLLMALMLESSNDVAVAIAEGVGGSVEAFCDGMTKKAKEIGAENTSFKTPNGLDKDGHYTTAYDLALIARYAMENKEFQSIINTSSYSFQELDGKRSFTVNNKNAFLNLYEGANGVKTGFTGKAGYCFVGSAEQNGMKLIAVILACSWPPNKTYRWHDTIALMDYGFSNFQYRNILLKGKIAAVYGELSYSIPGETKAMVTQDVFLICKTEDKIDVMYRLRDIKEAPVHQGELLGKAIVYLNGEVYTTIDILATDDIQRFDFWYCLRKVLDSYYI